MAVYPCVYREHRCPVKTVEMLRGLSLCIQGTFHAEHLVDRQPRFIPVYTGNITSFNANVIDIAVYPCVYREHTVQPSIYEGSLGLSLCIQGT